MKKSKLAVVIALIAVSMVTLVGSSYALFTKTLEGTKKVTVKTGTLKVDFTEGNRINLEGQAPVTDSTGQSGTPYTFTITNSGTINTVYSIINEERGCCIAALERRTFENETKGKNPGWYRR